MSQSDPNKQPRSEYSDNPSAVVGLAMVLCTVVILIAVVAILTAYNGVSR